MLERLRVFLKLFRSHIVPALSKAQKEKIALFKTSLSKLNQIHRYVKLAKTKHSKLELKFVQSLEPFIRQRFIDADMVY